MDNTQGNKNTVDIFSQHIQHIIKHLETIKPLSGTAITVPEQKETIEEDKYIWAVYQSIEELSEKNPTTYPGLIDMIYFLTYSNYQHCTGKISIIIENNELSFNTLKDNLWNPVGELGDYSHEFKSFVDNLVKRVQESDCPFTTLFFTVEGQVKDYKFVHQNIIIIFKQEGKIHIAIYDPHGVKAIKPIRKTSNKFLQQIQNLKPDIFVIRPRFIVSCPIGLQKYANDNFGWCIMFSLFWLYCVLYISLKTKNGITINNIKLVEQILLQYAKSPQLLYIMTKKFAVYVTNSYIQFITRNGNPNFNRELTKEVKRVIKSEPSIEKSKYKKHKKMSSKKEQTQYYKTLSKHAKEKSNRKQDGASCKKDDDCLSDICKQNKCISYSDAYGSKKRKR